MRNHLCEKCPKEYSRIYHLKRHEKTCNGKSENSISKTKSVLLWMMDGEEVNINFEIRENDFEKDIEKLVGNVENKLVVEDVLDNILDCLVDESLSLLFSKVKCTECDLWFTTTYSMIRHKQNQHNIITFKDIKSFKCEICSKDFNKKHHLNRHKSKIHSVEVQDEKEMKCEHCEKSYSSKFSLKRHMKNDHSVSVVNKNIYNILIL